MDRIVHPSRTFFRTGKKNLGMGVDKRPGGAYNAKQSNSKTVEQEEYPEGQPFREPWVVGSRQEPFGEWTCEGRVNGVKLSSSCRGPYPLSARRVCSTRNKRALLRQFGWHRRM